MTIWKILGLIGAGAAFILIFSCFGVAPYADQILTVIAGLCAAIFSMLAFIADQLSAKKSWPRFSPHTPKAPLMQGSLLLWAIGLRLSFCI